MRAGGEETPETLAGDGITGDGVADDRISIGLWDFFFLLFFLLEPVIKCDNE